MNVAFLSHRVVFDAASRTAHAEAEIRNTSSEPWRPAAGFAVGYHLFDAETGTLVVDGSRVPPARDVAPGEQMKAALEFQIPPEDGRYQVFVSPMREGVCWYYDRGWPFLLAEFELQGGIARLTRERIATAVDLRRERAVRSIGRAFTYPVLSIWNNRGLIRSMAGREILGRYRGSAGGAIWAILSPLLLMLTYFFVFGLVLHSRLPGDSSAASFALYFLAGMLPWLAFSEALGRAPGVILEHRNFVKKLVFAVETLPVNLVAAGLVTELFALIVFCIFLLVLRGSVPATAAWLPALIIPQALMTVGLCWFLAALGVFLRDLGQLIGFILTIWFFLTPICYPDASLAMLPHFATLMLAKNPMYVLVQGYRAVLLHAEAPSLGSLWKLWLLSVGMFVAGHAWFYKLRKSFPDII